MDQDLIRRRASAREQARMVAGMIVEDAGRIRSDAQGAFWEELRKMLPMPAEKTVVRGQGSEIEPMTDRQARCFGRSHMPFGKYQGTSIDEVPLEYLQKLCDPQPFICTLKRYLKSTRIAIEEEAAEQGAGN